MHDAQVGYSARSGDGDYESLGDVQGGGAAEERWQAEHRRCTRVKALRETDP